MLASVAFVVSAIVGAKEDGTLVVSSRMLGVEVGDQDASCACSRAEFSGLPSHFDGVSVTEVVTTTTGTRTPAPRSMSHFLFRVMYGRSPSRLSLDMVFEDCPSLLIMAD